MITSTSATLRLVGGFALLFAAGQLGYQMRSPWIIPPLGLVFTILYIQGKWREWLALWRADGLVGWIKGFALAFVIQIAMASTVYAFGFGLATLLQDGGAQPFSMEDVKALGAMLALWLALGLGIGVAERRAAARQRRERSTPEE